MVVLLEVLEENKDAVAGFAATIGGLLAKSILFAVDSFFKFVALIEQAKIGFMTMRQILRVLAIALGEFVLGAMEGLSSIPLIGPKIREGLGGAIAASEADIGRMNRELAQTANAIDEARARQQAFITTGADAVERIEKMAAGFQKAADASGDIEAPETSDAIMTMVGVDKNAKKNAENTAKALDSFVGKLDGLRTKFRSAGMAISDQTKESDRLQFKLEQLASAFTAAQEEAEALGAEGVAAFKEVESGMIASMNAIAAAIPDAQRQERAERAGGLMSGAADALASGGLSVLGGLGPVGAGAASLIGFGQAGDQAFDAAVEETAQDAADERREQLEDEAEAAKAAGASEADLAARGLDAESIAEAGEVSEADLAAAAEEVDRGEIMRDMVRDAVEGVIDGIASLLEGLPEILTDLIPLFLVKLPTAIQEMIPTLIEELIPVLLFEMPKAMFKMLLQLIPRLLKMLFNDLPTAIMNGVTRWFDKVFDAIKDLFSFGFQTGGYVARTGLALVHQGERVVPSNGAGTGTATAGLQAFTGGPGMSLTINTATVDPDSVPALGRLLERDLGAHGRVENDLFGRPAPFTSF